MYIYKLHNSNSYLQVRWTTKLYLQGNQLKYNIYKLDKPLNFIFTG